MGLSTPKNPPMLSEVVAAPVSTGAVFNALIPGTQVNQIHGIAPNNSSGAGIPKQVSNVQVSIANAQTGATCTIAVLFQRDPSDKSFSGVNIWVKGYQGNAQLVQVASGASSPAKFVLNNTGETVSFTIQAFGNGGNAPISQAPTSSGTLPKSTTGGFGTGTTNYYNVTNPPPGSTPVGASLVPIGAFNSGASSSGFANEYLTFVMPSGIMAGTGGRFKICFNLPVGVGNKMQLLNAVIRDTLPDGLTFKHTAQIKWAGISNPLFSTPGTDYISDEIDFVIDGRHDVYIFLKVDPSATYFYTLFFCSLNHFSSDLNAGSAHYDTDASLAGTLTSAVSNQSCGLRFIQTA